MMLRRLSLCVGNTGYENIERRSADGRFPKRERPSLNSLVRDGEVSQGWCIVRVSVAVTSDGDFAVHLT